MSHAHTSAVQRVGQLAQPLRPFAARFQNIPLHAQLRRARWAIPFVVLALAALHQLALHFIVAQLAPAWQPWAQVLIYGATGSIVAWVALTWIAGSVANRARVETQLRVAAAELEANHQKLSALNDLGNQLASAHSEQEVLELAAQAPLRLAHARASTVVTFDDNANSLKLDVAWGLSENYVRALRAQIDTGIDAARCRTCTVLKTHASSDCPLFVGMHEHARAEGIGSLVCLPIVREQTRVGVIAAYFPSVNGPPEDQVRLLDIVGGAVAAMLESLRTRTRHLSALTALDGAAHLRDTLGDFATQVLDITLAGWEAQAGGLFLYDAATQTWTCRAQRGLGDDLTDPRLAFVLQFARETHAAGAPRVIADRQPAFAAELASLAAAPLITDRQPLGVIVLAAKRPHALNQRHLDLLATVAHQIALAIRNAQLYTQVGQMAIYEERYRLAREIHDGLAQTLAYLGLQAERVEKLIATNRAADAATEIGEMRQSIRAAYVDAREAIDGLRLSVEKPEQLATQFADYVAGFARQTGIDTRLTVTPENLTTDAATALQLLRIAQEALTNIRKHAHAQHIQVHLVARAHELELTVADDGRGFPDEQSADAARGFRRHGLASMRERAQSIGGTLTIATGPGQGTRITVTLPQRGNR